MSLQIIVGGLIGRFGIRVKNIIQIQSNLTQPMFNISLFMRACGVAGGSQNLGTFDRGSHIFDILTGGSQNFRLDL